MTITSETTVPEGYDPAKDGTYMSPTMLAFFRDKLEAWKAEIVDETRGSVESMKSGSLRHPDPTDTAAATADHQFELRTRDRQRKLVAKIDNALRRIAEGEYGYCERTGDEIGVPRLLARPVATLTIEAQEAHERGERTRA